MAVHPISGGWPLSNIASALPANRYGSDVDSAAQLIMIMEVVTLTAFGVISVVCLQQVILWNDVIGFALLCRAGRRVTGAPG